MVDLGEKLDLRVPKLVQFTVPTCLSFSGTQDLSWKKLGSGLKQDPSRNTQEWGMKGQTSIILSYSFSILYFLP